MKKIILTVVLMSFSVYGFSQFKVGRSKEEVKADKEKVTPKRIGVKTTALTADYELYAVGDDKEFLRYITKGGMGTEIYEVINFTDIKEEADFYKYVLGLYDDFKDNEILINNMKIVPREMKLLGMKNIMFDVYPKSNSDYKNSTIMLSKKAWINLFKNSRVHKI